MMLGMGLGLLLLVGLLVVVPLALLGGGVTFLQNRDHGRNLLGSAGSAADPVSPRDLLDARLARGEISIAEYREVSAAMKARRDA